MCVLCGRDILMTSHFFWLYMYRVFLCTGLHPCTNELLAADLGSNNCPSAIYKRPLPPSPAAAAVVFTNAIMTCASSAPCVHDECLIVLKKHILKSNSWTKRLQGEYPEGRGVAAIIWSLLKEFRDEGSPATVFLQSIHHAFLYPYFNSLQIVLSSSS